METIPIMGCYPITLHLSQVSYKDTDQQATDVKTVSSFQDAVSCQQTSRFTTEVPSLTQ